MKHENRKPTLILWHDAYGFAPGKYVLSEAVRLVVRLSFTWFHEVLFSRSLEFIRVTSSVQLGVHVTKILLPSTQEARSICYWPVSVASNAACYFVFGWQSIRCSIRSNRYILCSHLRLTVPALGIPPPNRDLEFL